MKKLRISAAKIHSIAGIVSFLLAFAITTTSGIFWLTDLQAQARTPVERVTRLEVQAENLAQADNRLVDQVVALSKREEGAESRIAALESTVGAWKLAVFLLGGLITVLQGILLITRGRIVFATEEVRRRGATHSD